MYRGVIHVQLNNIKAPIAVIIGLVAGSTGFNVPCLSTAPLRGPNLQTAIALAAPPVE